MFYITWTQTDRNPQALHMQAPLIICSILPGHKLVANHTIHMQWLLIICLILPGHKLVAVNKLYICKRR